MVLIIVVVCVFGFLVSVLVGNKSGEVRKRTYWLILGVIQLFGALAAIEAVFLQEAFLLGHRSCCCCRELWLWSH